MSSTVPPSNGASRADGGKDGLSPSYSLRATAARMKGVCPASCVAAPSHSQAQRR